MYDPFDNDPYAGILAAYGQTPKLTQRSLFPALPQEEEQSLLSRAGHQVLGGLQFVGDTLAKPGRAVRGLLSGRPGELLNLLPFSDTLGITDPSKQVTGRNLLEQMGMVSKGVPGSGLDLGDVAGFGADLLTDPFMYINPASGLFKGALTGAGKTAKAAGTLAPTLAKRIALGQGGLGTIGLPGTAGTVFGTGQMAEKLAGHLGDLYETARFGKYSPALPFTALFSKDTGGALNPLMQKANIEKAAAERISQAGVRASLNDLLVEANKVGGLTPNAGRELRQILEGTLTGPAREGLPEVASGLKGLYENYRTALEATGVPAPTLQDIIEFAPRQTTPLPEQGGMLSHIFGVKKRGISTFDPSQLERLEEFKNIPGGTTAINEMVKNAELRGIQPLDAAARIRAKHLGLPNEATDLEMRQLRQHLGMIPGEQAGEAMTRQQLQAELSRLNNLASEAAREGATLGPQQIAQQQSLIQRLKPFERLEELQGKYRQSEKLAQIVQSLDPRYAEQGLDFFANHPLVDSLSHLLSRDRAIQGAKAIHGALGASASTDLAGVPFLEALTKSLGQDRDYLEALRQHVMGGVANPSVEGALKQAIQATGVSSPQELLKLTVPQSLVKDISRTTQALSAPEALQPVLNAFDWMTKMTKLGQTTFWPGYHARNAVQDVFQKAIHGATEPGQFGPMAILKPIMDAKATMRGGVLEDLANLPIFHGMNPQEATEEFNKLYAAHFPGRINPLVQLGDLAGEAGLRVPGTDEGNLLASMGRKFGEKASLKNPVSWLEGGAAAGGELAERSNELMRKSTFLAGLRQGMTPEVAADFARKVHFDYGNLSGFERSVMRRAAPFYNWCVPDYSLILTRDGWKTCDGLCIGEEVLTYNMEHDYLEWQPCENKAVFPYDGEIVAMETRRRRIVCTAEHRWPVRISAMRTKRPYGIYEYAQRFTVCQTKELRGTHALIAAARLKTGEHSLLTPKQARLLGWIVTDGSWRKRGNHIEAVIYQSPKKFLSEVQEVAGGVSRSPHPQTGVICTPVRKNRLYEIAPYLRKENLPSVVTRLSVEAAEAMYDAMYKADGLTYDGRECSHFAAENDGVRTAFRILAAMLGKQTSENERGCYISSRRFLKRQSMSVRNEYYQGRVWCPTTKNGTWVMKQGMVITITGNSRQNLPALAEELASRPGGPLAQTIHATNRLQEKGESAGGFMPQYIRENFSLPLGTTEQGTQRFLSRLGLPFEDLGKFQAGPGGARRTAENALSLLNPILKGPLEWLANRQFYSGRQLSDLGTQGLTGNIPADLLLTNSPISRLLTTARTLEDERKGIGAKLFNVLGPAKVTDIDVEKQQQIEGRKLLDAMLAGSPEIKQFQQFYVPRDQAALDKLTPDQVLLMRLQTNLSERAKMAALEQKAKAGDAKAALELQHMKAKMR